MDSRPATLDQNHIEGESMNQDEKPTRWHAFGVTGSHGRTLCCLGVLCLHSLGHNIQYIKPRGMKHTHTVQKAKRRVEDCRMIRKAVFSFGVHV